MANYVRLHSIEPSTNRAFTGIFRCGCFSALILLKTPQKAIESLTITDICSCRDHPNLEADAAFRVDFSRELLTASRDPTFIIHHLIEDAFNKNHYKVQLSNFYSEMENFYSEMEIASLIKAMD